MVKPLQTSGNQPQTTKIANQSATMTELAEQRINFIAQLHEAFLLNKGYGAFAYISITDISVPIERRST
ncbi:hypothetical protein [Bathymodiolus japonicus methanotrophic gill symbiont]|uniref:hypothetical protein n=1 Tax=Bathymodiolus japonicus methanotrophic gill symbiont TaxID=113269 RepID=UPI001C8E8C09|nr:hypothetical protein [Bathymodiolus japonicus methanotrophic gill symbiont]